MCSLAGAALLFVQFKDLQKPYVSSWIIGVLLGSIGVTLILLKDFVPNFVSYTLGASFNFAGYFYFYYSITLCVLFKLYPAASSQ